MLFSFSQIAARTKDINGSVNRMTAQGHTAWIRDEVHAVHLYGHPAFRLGEEFQVKLAFNYELFPTMEFELIELVGGKTVQLIQESTISHFGYHTKDQQPEGLDTLVEELKRLENAGLDILQVSETVKHAGTSRRYRYAFVFFPDVGAPVKIIQRMDALLKAPDDTVAAGKEMFKAWLSPKG
jgi:hypothetical protein